MPTAVRVLGHAPTYRKHPLPGRGPPAPRQRPRRPTRVNLCHVRVTNSVDAPEPPRPNLRERRRTGPRGRQKTVPTTCAMWDRHGSGRAAASLSVAGRSAFEATGTHRAEILEPRSPPGCRLSTRYSHSPCQRQRQVSSLAVRHGGLPWGNLGRISAAGEHRLHKTARTLTDPQRLICAGQRRLKLHRPGQRDAVDNFMT